MAPAAAALLTYFLSGGLTVGHTSYVRAGSNKRDGRTHGQRFSVPSVIFGKEDLLCIDRDGFRTQRGAGKTRNLPIYCFLPDDPDYPMKFATNSKKLMTSCRTEELRVDCLKPGKDLQTILYRDRLKSMLQVA